MSQLIDLTDKTFGDYTVLRYTGHQHWRVQCVCGRTCTVRGDMLREGGAKCHCAPRDPMSLSARQTEVAQMAADGLYNKQIAHKLKISVQTVKNILSQAYEKLGVNDRAALATMLSRKAATMTLQELHDQLQECVGAYTTEINQMIQATSFDANHYHFVRGKRAEAAAIMLVLREELPTVDEEAR